MIVSPVHKKGFGSVSFRRVLPVPSLVGALPLRAFAAALVYVSGYYQIHPIWFVFAWGLVQLRNLRRHDKHIRLESATAVDKRNQRLLVVSNVSPLPSWISYTDVERCEWVNRVVHHLWPNIQAIVLGLLKEVEPLLNEKFSKYKNNPNFSFSDINLGTNTPRLSGIRVYHDPNRGDMSIIDAYAFFVSDTVFNFSVMNLSFGCDKFEIRGCIRAIVSTPETSHFPGVEVFFLEKPKLNFNLTGVLNVAELPGIKGIIRNAINDAISHKLVLPNKFVLKYNKNLDISQVTFPDPVGLLKVSVIEAKSLGRTTRLTFSNSKNPSSYVKIVFGSKCFQSPIVDNTTDPVWNFTAEFIIESLIDEKIKISVEEHSQIDWMSKVDDPFSGTGAGKQPISEETNLGELSFTLIVLKNKPTFNLWIPLESAVSGMIHLNVSFHKLEKDPELLISSVSQVILEILIDEATNLTTTKGNVFAQVSVGGATLSSRTVSTDDPTFREVFSFPVQNPLTDKLKIDIKRENGKKSIGNTEFDIKKLLDANNMEIVNELTKINGASANSRLSLSMRLRTIKS